MKRTVLYLFFFITLHVPATAQQQSLKTPLLIDVSPDSVQMARKQWHDAVAVAGSDTARALNLARASLRFFRRNNLPLDEGRCYMIIADIYYNAELYGRSFGSYRNAQDLFYEVSPRDLAAASMGVAKTQYYRGLYRFSIKSFSEVIEYAVKNNDLRMKATAAEYLGFIYVILQSNSRSKYYFTNAFFTSQQLQDDKSCLRLGEKLFTLYYRDHQYDSAYWFSNYNYSLTAKLHEQNSQEQASLNRIMAMIRLKKWEEAKQDLNSFRDKEASQSDLNTRIRFETVYASYYMAQSDREKAVALYDSAVKHASATNTPDLLSVVYSSMADAYAEQHNYEQAYRYSLKYFEAMENFYSNSISYLSKIESLVKEDVADNRIRYLSSLNKIKALELLRSADMRKGLENENRWKDSILQKEKELSIALGQENKYKTAQLGSQQVLSQALNRESQWQKKQLQKEYALRGILIGGLAGLLLLGGLAYYHYKRARAKNRIIEKQSEELQVLMKEIHHRVKNNLQIISSLLDIQSMSLDNNSAAQAIREGKNRVQSMAIIHQFLYHENNIRGIWVEDYIRNLSENLFASYNITPGKIQLQTDIDKLNLDVDTVIPLGLIINELVSNSLKYAFEGMNRGTVFISLKEKDHSLQLQVRDNGKGFPGKEAIHQKQSFGLQLIAAFAQKLKAKLEMYNNNGAVVMMNIKKYKLA